MNPTNTINGRTFAQASQGITDRAQLGAIAQQYQSAAQNPQLLSYYQNLPGTISANNLGSTTSALPQAPAPRTTATNNLQTAVDTTFTGSQVQNKDGSITTNFADGSTNIPLTTDQQRSSFSQQLKDVFTKLGTKGQRTAEIQQEEGVQDKKTELRNIETEAMALDKSFQKRIDNILGSGSMTREQAAPQVNELQRMQNSQKADLAIRQRVAQGNYTDAFEIAKMKVDAEFEPLESQLDSLKTQIDFFQNDMTASEKLKAEQTYQEKRDALDFARQKQLIAYKASIDGSGGADQLLSIAEAKALGVPYGTTRAQAMGKRSLTAPQQEAQNNANSALLALNQLTNSITDPNGGFKQSKLLNWFGLGKVQNNLRELRDVITRVRTGAALSKNEESFYKSQVPRAIDSSDTIKQKLNNLAAFYSGISGSSVTLRLPDGTVVVADDMFDGDTRTEVRQAIADGADVISY